jgi:hypothetical protein
MTAAATLVGFLQILRESVNDRWSQDTPSVTLCGKWKVTVEHRLHFELHFVPFAERAAPLPQTCPTNCHEDMLGQPAANNNHMLGLASSFGSNHSMHG